MTGKIELIVKIGYSKKPSYDSYPYWALRVTGESGKNHVILTPEKRQIECLLRDIIVHEMRVDLTRDRKPDAIKWKTRFQNVLEESQRKVKDYDIPQIYNAPKIIKDEIVQEVENEMKMEGDYGINRQNTR